MSAWVAYFIPEGVTSLSLSPTRLVSSEMEPRLRIPNDGGEAERERSDLIPTRTSFAMILGSFVRLHRTAVVRRCDILEALFFFFKGTDILFLRVHFLKLGSFETEHVYGDGSKKLMHLYIFERGPRRV